MKIYAVLFSNGAQMICNEPWAKFEPLVYKVKGCVYRGFKDVQSAENWLLIQRMKQKKPQKSDISKYEARARTINTPYWKKELGKVIASRIELDQGFNRNIRGI